MKLANKQTGLVLMLAKRSRLCAQKLSQQPGNKGITTITALFHACYGRNNTFFLSCFLLVMVQKQSFISFGVRDKKHVSLHGNARRNNAVTVHNSVVEHDPAQQAAAFIKKECRRPTKAFIKKKRMQVVLDKGTKLIIEKLKLTKFT